MKTKTLPLILSCLLMTLFFGERAVAKEAFKRLNISCTDLAAKNTVDLQLAFTEDNKVVMESTSAQINLEDNSEVLTLNSDNNSEIKVEALRGEGEIVGRKITLTPDLSNKEEVYILGITDQESPYYKGKEAYLVLPDSSMLDDVICHANPPLVVKR